MSESNERVLNLFAGVMAQMSDAEQEKLLWLCEGMAIAARAQATEQAQDSA